MATRRLENDDDSGVRIPATTEPTVIENDETEIVVNRFRALLGSSEAASMKVRVYRINPRTGEMELCEEIAASMFNESEYLADIRDKWGAGKYEFRLIGAKGIAAKSTQSIAELPNKNTQSTVQTQSSNADLITFMREMQQSNEKLLREMRENAPKSESLGAKDILGLLALAKDLFAQPASRPSEMDMVAKVFEMVKGAKAAINELADEEREPKDPLSAAIPGLLDLVKSATQGSQQQVIPQIHVPAPVTSIQQVASETVEQTNVTQTQTNETPEQLIVRGAVEGLIEFAEKNLPVREASMYVEENLPDELQGYLTNKYWFEAFANYFPMVKPHEKYLRAVRDDYLLYIKELDARDRSPE